MLYNLKYINYSTIARHGFFELMIVTLLNMVLILLSKRFDVSDKDKKVIKIMNIIMIALTLVIIASSFVRMHMYEIEFGYTTSRVLVDAILITETILMIPTVMYIINDKFNVAKSFLIVIIIAYTFVSFINIDGLVAYKNVNRYHNGSKIDLDYLMNYRTDNINVLVNLYENTDDKRIRDDLRNYFVSIYGLNVEENWEDFNISRHNAIKLLEDKGLN